MTKQITITHLQRDQPPWISICIEQIAKTGRIPAAFDTGPVQSLDARHHEALGAIEGPAGAPLSGLRTLK